jgi:hypothetical protein
LNERRTRAFYKTTSVRIMIVITDGDDTDGVRTPTEGLVS